jgi:VanZ family protein
MQHWRYWLLATAIMMAIFAGSNIPHLSLYDGRSLSPEWLKWIHAHTLHIGTTGFFSYVISPHPDFILHKLGHIGAFGLLGTILYLATGRSVRWGLFLTAFYAASDELHQYFVAGRSSRFGDILLDITAAACFILVLRMLERHRRKKRFG